MAEETLNHNASERLTFRSKIVKCKTAAVVIKIQKGLFPADLNKACGNTMEVHEAAQMH